MTATAWAPDDLVLAIQRHATSKLDESDLFDIRTLGFPRRSLAVDRVDRGAGDRVAAHGRREAFEIVVERGVEPAVRPAAVNRGTRVEVGRSVFGDAGAAEILKASAPRTMAVSEMVKRLAMAHPGVGFALTTARRTGLRLPP